MKNLLGTSWRTTLGGVIVILCGLWTLKCYWAPHQSLWFNITKATAIPIALMIIGNSLIHARDHKTSEEAHKQNENKIRDSIPKS